MAGFVYLTSCVGWAGQTCSGKGAGYDIQQMVNASRPVTRSTFLGHVDREDLRDVEAALGYDRWMPMSRDPFIGYYRSKFCGAPAYYFTHSAIEHIFIDPSYRKKLNVRRDPAANYSFFRNGLFDELPSWAPLAAGVALIGIPLIAYLAKQKTAQAALPAVGQGTMGLPDNKTMQDRFGPLFFVPDPQPNNPEAIRITNGWEQANIVSVPLPELGKTVQFNKRCAGKLQQLVSAWAAAGILGDIVSWDGTYVSRFIRGSRTKLSPHAFGNALDINAAMNPFRQPGAAPGEYGNVWRLVEVAQALGWNCGANWPAGQTDAMHFQIDNC